MSDRLLKESDVLKAIDKRVEELSKDPVFIRKNGIIDIMGVKKHILAIPSADRPQEWIPCSERLPEESGDYLVCPIDSVLEDYSDFDEVMIMPYDADCEGFGWWTERYDPISLGFVDSDFNEFEVIAWQPLPEPWKGADDE